MLVALAALGGGTLATSGPAQAASPCWKTLLNDWFDGRIDGTYPARCYREAIQRLPDDVDTYSSAREDLQRALYAALRASGNPKGPNAPLKPPPQQGGTTTTGRPTQLGTTTDSETDTTALSPTGDSNNDDGLFGTALDTVKPGNADSVPLPLIVLAVLAMLLLAAAGAGLVNRRLQARKAQAPTPPGDDSHRAQ